MEKHIKSDRFVNRAKSDKKKSESRIIQFELSDMYEKIIDSIILKGLHATRAEVIRASLQRYFEHLNIDKW